MAAFRRAPRAGRCNRGQPQTEWQRSRRLGQLRVSGAIRSQHLFRGAGRPGAGDCRVVSRRPGVAPVVVGLGGSLRGGGMALLARSARLASAALATWSAISTVERWRQPERERWRSTGVQEVRNARTGEVLPLYTDVLDDIEQHAAELDIQAAAARIAVPWLIVHGGEDEAVSIAEAKRLAEAAGAPAANRGAHHRRRRAHLRGGASVEREHSGASTGSSTPHLRSLRKSSGDEGRPGFLADLTGRVCVVTGATRGIGRATAEGLAALGASLVLLCRRLEVGAEVAESIASSPEDTHPEWSRADLASLASVRSAAGGDRPRALPRSGRADQQRRHHHPAPRGDRRTVWRCSSRSIISRYFLLTNLLLDALAAGAPARIVNVSSGAHAGRRLEFDELQSERRYHRDPGLRRTKLANILFTHELARRLEGSGVTANCGPSRRGRDRTALRLPEACRRAGGASEPARSRRGAELYLAASPEVAGCRGGTSIAARRPGRPRHPTTRPRRGGSGRRARAWSARIAPGQLVAGAANLRHAHLLLSLHRLRHRVRAARPQPTPRSPVPDAGAASSSGGCRSPPARPRPGSPPTSVASVRPPSGGCCGGCCHSHQH